MLDSVFLISSFPLGIRSANKHAHAIGHLKISWTSTAELEIDKLSRDDLIRVHVEYFTIYCFTSMVNR